MNLVKETLTDVYKKDLSVTGATWEATYPDGTDATSFLSDESLIVTFEHNVSAECGCNRMEMKIVIDATLAEQIPEEEPPPL